SFFGHGTLGLQWLSVRQKLIPAEGARMILPPENAPLLQGLFTAACLSGAPVFDHGLGLGATISQRTSITWIDQHLVHAVPSGPTPNDLASRPAWLNLTQWP